MRPPESVDDVHERELEIRAKEAQLARDYEVCPACYKPVEKDFLICPSCMKKLRKSCVECGTRAQAALDRLPVLQDQAVAPIAE